MPDVCFKSGPIVVVNLAESAFSGSRELRMEPKLGAELDGSFSGTSDTSAGGTSTSYSLMIWSAIFLRSDERNGASALIWGV